MVSLTHILNKNEASCQVKYAVACNHLQCMYHDYGKNVLSAGIQDDKDRARNNFLFLMKSVQYIL